MSKATPETSVQDALNYRFYLDRLDDPGLLDRAVITEDGDLAVPAGGKRLGGYVSGTPGPQPGVSSGSWPPARTSSPPPGSLLATRLACRVGTGTGLARDDDDIPRTMLPQGGTSASARRRSRPTAGSGQQGRQDDDRQAESACPW